jgi:type II secretory pathway component PulM
MQVIVTLLALGGVYFQVVYPLAQGRKQTAANAREQLARFGTLLDRVETHARDIEEGLRASDHGAGYNMGRADNESRMNDLRRTLEQLPLEGIPSEAHALLSEARVGLDKVRRLHHEGCEAVISGNDVARQRVRDDIEQFRFMFDGVREIIKQRRRLAEVDK